MCVLNVFVNWLKCGQDTWLKCSTASDTLVCVADLSMKLSPQTVLLDCETCEHSHLYLTPLSYF